MEFIKKVFKKILVPLVILITAVVISISLYLYQSGSQSYLFHSTTINTSDAFGSFGANVAAILYYLFGGASYLFIPLLCFVLFLSFKKNGFYHERDRLFFAVISVFAISSLQFAYSYDVLQSSLPGGVVGHDVYIMLARLFYPIGALLLLHFVLIGNIFILTRFSFMPIVRKLCGFMCHLGKLFYEYRVAHKFAYYSYLVIKMVIARPVMICAIFIRELITGKALLETGLIAPESNDYSAELVAFYAELKKEQNTELDVQLPQSIIPQPRIAHHEEEAEYIQKASNDQQSLPDTAQIEEASQKNISPASSIQEYALPSLDIFIGVKDEQHDEQLKKELEERAQILQEKLERFGISGTVVAIKRGPVVTVFEYQPQIDTKLSKILSLEDDLAMALKALSIRILAPIPGRSVVGFEVANKNRKDVVLAQVIKSSLYQESKYSLPLILGEDTIGNTVIVDLARMPHLLIAGSTGSGKSVALNAMLMSLLCKLGPDDLKMILIDPKRLEFASYADIAHLLFPIVTDPKRAAPVLRWVVKEMEDRYEKMAEKGSRNIFDYNDHADKVGEEKMPFIVIVIDELSDLMLTAGRDIEDLITRITQMARAAGIHMIVATQRPSVDVITGLIKVNIPSRISFRVTSRVDSRTILDCVGSEKLLGRGDMLFLDGTNSQMKRVHGAYVSDAEIEQVVTHIRSQRVVEYLDLNAELIEQKNNISEADDELYQDVLAFLDEVDEVSISLLQRKFRIGYNRSARIIDILESQGLIMPPDGSKTRKVIR